MSKLSLVAIFVTTSVISRAEGPLPKHSRFPTGSYDYYGYARWGSFSKMSPLAARLLPLVKEKKFSIAFPRLKQAWILNPKDVDLLQGLTECARKIGKLGELLDLIADEGRKVTSPRSRFPSHFSLAFQYTLGVKAYEVSESESGFKYSSSLGTGPAEFYYGRIYDDQGALDQKNRASVMMYVSSLFTRGELGMTRRVARKVLAENPDFYQLRLFLSATLDQGIVVSWKDNKKVEPQEDEKSNPRLGLKEAETVIARFPHVVDSYYLAGIYARVLDKRKAKMYLSHFVEKSEPGTSRYIIARRFLDELSPNKTPQRGPPPETEEALAVSCDHASITLPFQCKGIFNEKP